MSEQNESAMENTDGKHWGWDDWDAPVPVDKAKEGTPELAKSTVAYSVPPWSTATLGNTAMNHYAGDVPWAYNPLLAPTPYTPPIIQPPTDWLTEDRMEALIQRVLDKLFPREHTGLVDARHYLRVRAWDEASKAEYSGYLYAIEKTEE